MVYDIASVILVVYMVCLLICGVIAFLEAYRSDSSKSSEDISPSDSTVVAEDSGTDVNIGLSNALSSIDGAKADDDLKLIKGVGPKLEGVLHSIGVYTFAQIAAWSEEDVAKVDTHLKFSGRIGRDEWIAQARDLTKG